MKPARWRSSSSRPVARRRMALSVSSTYNPLSFISARHSSLAARTMSMPRTQCLAKSTEVRGRSPLSDRGEREATQSARKPTRLREHQPAERLSPSGIPVKTVYRPEDAELDYKRELGDPGDWPYTRGVQSSMYRGRLWTMRQYAGF